MPSQAKINLGPSAGPANRAALLHAAREVFAESGFMAPLSSVARRAGVGQGSLYRHFPDRLALAVAVFDENVIALETISDDPDSTLTELFNSVAEQALASTALIDMMASEPEDPRAKELRDRVTKVASELLVRDQEQGRIASHVSTVDIMLSISMLAFLLSRTPPEDRAEAATRARAIFFAAFNPKGCEPSP